MRSLAAFVHRAVRARSPDEDRARREFIFNVLALSTLVLLFIGIVDNTVHSLASERALHQADSLSAIALYGLFLFFAVLYALSLRGHALAASFLLLAAFFDLAAYMGYRWGVDLPASLLFYALVVTMAGVLVSARFAFVTAALAGLSIGITARLSLMGRVFPDRRWITELWKMEDVLVATLIFLVIATVAWLSNREIEKSLLRARRSEAELRAERDLLEERVEERSRELQQAELERMTQAYRFVEFGRLASGIFHDLMNPLTGLTINIDRIAASSSRAALSGDIERARQAATHMQNLLSSMRRHMKRESFQEFFSVREALEGALSLMTTHAREHGVECRLEAGEDVSLFGDTVAFTQAVLNLLGNAIQSYGQEGAPGSVVRLRLAREGDLALLSLQDNGSGIAPLDLERIFEPYFTTKKEEGGLGLGLSHVRRIIEKHFAGRITVESEVGEGTVFTLHLPIREP